MAKQKPLDPASLRLIYSKSRLQAGYAINGVALFPYGESVLNPARGDLVDLGTMEDMVKRIVHKAELHEKGEVLISPAKYAELHDVAEYDIKQVVRTQLAYLYGVRITVDEDGVSHIGIPYGLESSRWIPKRRGI